MQYQYASGWPIAPLLVVNEDHQAPEMVFEKKRGESSGV
jgi:hypothetical protein